MSYQYHPHGSSVVTLPPIQLLLDEADRIIAAQEKPQEKLKPQADSNEDHLTPDRQLVGAATALVTMMKNRPRRNAMGDIYSHVPGARVNASAPGHPAPPGQAAIPAPYRTRPGEILRLIDFSLTPQATNAEDYSQPDVKSCICCPFDVARATWINKHVEANCNIPYNDFADKAYHRARYSFFPQPTRVPAASVEFRPENDCGGAVKGISVANTLLYRDGLKNPNDTISLLGNRKATFVLQVDGCPPKIIEFYTMCSHGMITRFNLARILCAYYTSFTARVGHGELQMRINPMEYLRLVGVYTEDNKYWLVQMAKLL